MNWKLRMNKLRSLLFLCAAVVGLLALSGCQPRLDADTLYGVWKGTSKRYGPTLITFISKGRCELQHYRAKDSKIRTGSWRIKGKAVEVLFDAYPKLSLVLDHVSLDDGERRERLTDRIQGIEVIKM